MGDTVELTTYSSPVPKKFDTFYPINSNSFAVRVRSFHPVFIRLTVLPSSVMEPLYEINIGYIHSHNTLSNIKKSKDGPIKTMANTPYILSDVAYRSFSIRFHNKKISIFKENDTIPFLQCTDEMMPNFRFISFGNRERYMGRGPTLAFWRFEVPPTISAPSFCRLKYGAVSWKRLVNGNLPQNAFIAAVDDCPIYVARAVHEDTFIPGLYTEGLQHLLIPYGGRTVQKEDFEVLCSYSVSWHPTTSDQDIPPNAIPASTNYNDPPYYFNRRLVIVRGWQDGHVRVGYMDPRSNLGLIPYKGQEIRLKSFEVLVHKPTMIFDEIPARPRKRGHENNDEEETEQEFIYPLNLRLRL